METRRLFALLVVFDLAGCSGAGGGTGGSGGTPGIGGGGGSSGYDRENRIEPPPPLTGCAESSDCRGGEICVDDRCRVVCDAVRLCEGFYGLCDDDLGYCVQCVSTSDCPDDRICQGGLCAFYCWDDGACYPDELCDEPTGTCLLRECDEDGDCAGGYGCDDYRCVSLAPRICTPDGGRCEENVLYLCDSEGISESEEPCGEDAVCVQAGLTAACLPKICEPNSVSCENVFTAASCNANGTAETTIACDGDEYCDGGICKQPICTANAQECVGNRLLTCNALGSEVTGLGCDQAPECEGSFGCVCVVDACVDRVCEPLTQFCSGDGAQSCNADGTALSTPVACPELCVAGACVESSCTSGETQCAGSTLLTCNSSGDGWDTDDCSASGQICTSDAGASSCDTPLCTPYLVRCAPAGEALLICNANGSEQTSVPCEAEQYCEASICLNRACTPLETSCLGNALVACDERGAAETVTPCESFEYCAAGSCHEQSCTPNEIFCASSSLLAQCDEYGANLTETECGPGQYCEAGLCLDSVCGNGELEGEEPCDGDNLGGISCAALGLGDGELACEPDCTDFDTSDCDTMPQPCTHRAECYGGACWGGICMPCELDFFCWESGDTFNWICVDGQCQPPECLTAWDCPPGEACLDDGRCGLCFFDDDCRSSDVCNTALGICCPASLPECTEPVDPCGDGEIDLNEDCDGDNLGGTSCLDFGFSGGTLTCVDCTDFDTSGCIGATPSGLLIRLTWDDPVNDQDLHLTFVDLADLVCGEPWDCFFSNKTPVWFAGTAAGAGPNPALTRDDTNGLGPETIEIEEPADGTYRIYVNYWGDNGTLGSTEGTTNTIEVFDDGVVIADFSRTLMDPHQVWAVATIEVAGGEVTVTPYPEDTAGETGAVAVMENCNPPIGWDFP